MSLSTDPMPTAGEQSAETPTPARRRRLFDLLIAPESTVGLALVGLLVAFSVLSPGKFATLDNLRFLLGDSSVLVVLAMAMTFVIVSAHLDLSVGSIVAFSEVAAAKTMLAIGGDGVLVCLAGLIAAVAAGVAWGAINGWLITRANIPSFIVTLATLGIALGAALLITGGNDVASVPPGLVNDVGTASFLGVPILAWVAAPVVLASVAVLRFTRFGRYTHAIGSDRSAAERAGINVRRHVARIYVAAGAAYGLAAFMGLAEFSTTSVDGHSNDALNAIAAVAIGGASLYGGVGSALGTLIGVYIPAVLANGLVITRVQPFWQQVAVGIALLLAVYADQVRRRARARP